MHKVESLPLNSSVRVLDNISIITAWFLNCLFVENRCHHLSNEEYDRSNNNHVERVDFNDKERFDFTSCTFKMVVQVMLELCNTDGVLVKENSTLVKHNLHHFKTFAEKRQTGVEWVGLLAIKIKAFTDKEQNRNGQMDPSQGEECLLVRKHLLILICINRFLFIKSFHSRFIDEETADEKCYVEDDVASS